MKKLLLLLLFPVFICAAEKEQEPLKAQSMDEQALEIRKKIEVVDQKTLNTKIRSVLMGIDTRNTIEGLVAQGASVNRDDSGRPPLWYAAVEARDTMSKGIVDLKLKGHIKALIDAKADALMCQECVNVLLAYAFYDPKDSSKKDEGKTNNKDE